MELLDCLWQMHHTILDTSVAFKLTRLDTQDPKWKVTTKSMKPHRLRSANGTPLKAAGSVRLVTFMRPQIVETGFCFLESMAVEVHLGTKFTGHNTDIFVTRKKMIHLLGFHPIVIFSIDRDETMLEHVSNQTRFPVVCRVAKMIILPSRTPASVTMRVSVAALCMVNTISHLMQRRVEMVARGIYETSPNRPSTLFVANYSNNCSKLPRNILVPQCIQPKDTFWP